MQRTDQRSWKSYVKKTWSGPLPPLVTTQRKMVCTASQDALKEFALFLLYLNVTCIISKTFPMHRVLFYRFVHFLLCFNVILDSIHVQYVFFYPPVSVQYYQEFSCSAAVPGNGCNVEYALHVLHLLKGNIKVTDQGQ